ncbi:MAG: hypothetical protein ACOH2M_07740 [Cypionkella sp.]
MSMIVTPSNATSLTHPTTAGGLPRGIVILGLAAASWLVLAGVWLGVSQLFGFVAAAL